MHGGDKPNLSTEYACFGKDFNDIASFNVGFDVNIRYEKVWFALYYKFRIIFHRNYLIFYVFIYFYLYNN